MPGKNTQETGENGRLSARVVEEAYIGLQEALKSYRIARDQGNAAAGLKQSADPVIVLQNEVQTFFSLIRPYIKDAPELEEYWWGALAAHPGQPHGTIGEAFDYYREHSIGVWQSQKHTRAVPSEAVQQPVAGSDGGGETALADGGEPLSLAEIHDLLGLSNTIRVLSVRPTGADDDFDGWWCLEGRFAVLGLREIPYWTVETRRQSVGDSGFMSGQNSYQEVREPEPGQKVETAANMLIEVAEELSAIATYEPRGERVHGTPVPDT